MSEELKDEFTETREKIINFVSNKKDYLIYLLLAFIVWFGMYIRSRNIPLLRDITTNKAIPLALDPYVFLRYAEYIVEHGKLMAIDMMRYVPFGKSTEGIEKIIPYTIAYMYKILHIFIPSITLQDVDVIYPIIFFMFSGIMFFLLVKRLFNIKIAVLSTLFLAIIPAFLYRTMAGFSEKEPMGIFFMFATFYFYVAASQSKKMNKYITYGILAGIFTSLLGLAWGGVKFAFIIISLFTLIMIAMDRFRKKDFYIYVLWVIPWMITFTFITTKYGTLKSLIYSFSTGLALLVLIIAFTDFAVFKLNLIKIKDKIQGKLPLGISGIILGIFGSFLLATIIFGPGFILNQINEIINTLIHPMGINRWLLTVAENRQPFFTDWIGTFGKGFFFLFFLGSIVLFYDIIKRFKLKWKWKLGVLYTLFLCGFIFSRYSSGSAVWNGTSKLSNLVYVGSLVVFVGVIGILYLYSFYKEKDLYDKLSKLNRNYVFVLVWFILMIVAARGALRLFFVFAPITGVLASYLSIRTYDYIKTLKEISLRIFAFVILFLVLFNPLTIAGIPDGIILDFARESYNTAAYTGPSYNQQWQMVMAWVRESTPEDSVFIHWWDYGYWIQTGGKRATVLDGGNTFVYWNHLMGRYGLTHNNPKETLELFKTHNVTHFLIDSTDIGKYSAYSIIGSDESYDRYSWIGTFRLNPKNTMETRDETTYVYVGNTALDEDYIYNNMVLPGGNSGIGGFLVSVTKDTQEIKQPIGVFFYNGQQIQIPIECIYVDEQELHYGSGYPGCLRIMPSVEGETINQIGAALFMSRRITSGIMGQLYLLNRKIEGFELVHDDGDKFPLLLYNGRQIGPIKIWEISYTPDIKEREEFIKGDLPKWF